MTITCVTELSEQNNTIMLLLPSMQYHSMVYLISVVFMQLFFPCLSVLTVFSMHR